MYWCYIRVFRCLRWVDRLLFAEEKQEEIQPPTKWLAITAIQNGGDNMDVSDRVRDTFRSEAWLTPGMLARGLRMDESTSWHYMTPSFEYHKIPPEGVLNGL